MHSNVFGAVLAFLAGAGLAAAGYGLSRRVLKKNAGKYVAAQMAKQVIQVLFLVGLFVLGGRTPWDRSWLLVGGALGLTLPMVWFTYKLVRLNDAPPEREDSNDG